MVIICIILIQSHCLWSRNTDVMLRINLVSLSHYKGMYLHESPILCFFIPCHMIVAGHYVFTLDIPVSIHPSVICPSVHISFPDDNLSKHQWIFTKLSMCIDILEIWFGIVNGLISSNFDEIICPRHAQIYVSRR